MKSWTLIISVASICLFLAGCGTTAKFIYPANMNEAVRFDGTPSSKKVAVMPFDDYRGDTNNNLFWMGFVPLSPFGWGTYDRPDGAEDFVSINSYDVTPSEDLAKAAAVSLRHSNLFKEAFFTFGGDRDAADYVLSGRLKAMKYHGKRLTYCLSEAGTIFWIFGAPAGMSSTHLVVDLILSDKSGKVLWQWTIDKNDWMAQWIYARMGHDCLPFTYLYQEGMNDALNDLSEKMRNNSGAFK